MIIKIKTEKLDDMNHSLGSEIEEVLNTVSKMKDRTVESFNLTDVKYIEDIKKLNKYFHYKTKELLSSCKVYFVSKNQLFNNIHVAHSVQNNIIDESEEFVMIVTKNVSIEELFMY